MKIQALPNSHVEYLINRGILTNTLIQFLSPSQIENLRNKNIFVPKIFTEEPVQPTQPVLISNWIQRERELGVMSAGKNNRTNLEPYNITNTNAITNVKINTIILYLK